MTIKQKSIIVAIIVCTSMTDVLLLYTARIPKNIYLICILIILTIFEGMDCGRLIEKWKRDKEMANIVADRLLGKSKGTEPPYIKYQTQNLVNMQTGQLGAYQQGMANSVSQSINGLLGNANQRNTNFTGDIFGKYQKSYELADVD